MKLSKQTLYTALKDWIRGENSDAYCHVWRFLKDNVDQNGKITITAQELTDMFLKLSDIWDKEVDEYMNLPE